MAGKTRIKLGDKVRVINGHDKGFEGEVIRVQPSNHRIVIQGLNLRKKHQRQVQAGGRTMNPGIIQFEAPVDISNVMLLCPKCNEPTRVGLLREEGKTQRVCKKCQAVFDA